jgi:hypothetical protein
MASVKVLIAIAMNPQLLSSVIIFLFDRFKVIILTDST